MRNNNSITDLLKQNRYLLYQTAFIVLFGLISTVLIEDVSAAMSKKKPAIYLGILGLIAIVADMTGTIIKSQELRDFYPKTNHKLFGRFFTIFWIFRASVLAFGAIVTAIGFTGDPFDEDNKFGLGLMVVESMRWLVMGFVVYFGITEGRKKSLTDRKRFIGDISLMYSSLFYLACMWMSMNLDAKHWSIMTSSERWEYALAGFVLFLMIYVPATFFHFLENLMRSSTRKEKWRFWIGILITGILALSYPMLRL